MIAKVIVKGASRREAAAKLARTLEQIRIQGIANNRDYLVAILRTPEFLAGDTTTDFLERVLPRAERVVSEDELHAAAIAAALADRRARRLGAKVHAMIPPGFRNSVMPPETVAYLYRDQLLALEYRTRRDGGLSFTVNGRAYAVVERGSDASRTEFEIDGRRYAFSVVADKDRRFLHGAQGDLELTEKPRFPSAAGSDVDRGLAAPMPGAITSVLVAEGDRVERGQLLLVLEAMKMEHRVTAPWSGTVTKLSVAKGDQVKNGAILVAVEQGEG